MIYLDRDANLAPSLEREAARRDWAAAFDALSASLGHPATKAAHDVSDEMRDDHGRWAQEYGGFGSGGPGNTVFPTHLGWPNADLVAKVAATVTMYDSAAEALATRVAATNRDTGTNSGNLKDAVVTRLVSDTGLTYDRANQMIATWAHSATDSEPDSIALQMAAAARFGTDPGTYIKAQAEYMAGGYRAALEAGPPPVRSDVYADGRLVMEGTAATSASWREAVLGNAEAMHAFDEAVAMSQKMDPTTTFVVPAAYMGRTERASNPDYVGGLVRPFPGYGDAVYRSTDGWRQDALANGDVRFTRDNRLVGASPEGTSYGDPAPPDRQPIAWAQRMADSIKTVDAVYARTQAVLADQGIKEVTVFRGMNWQGSEDVGPEQALAALKDPSLGMPAPLWDMKEGETKEVVVSLNPLSSFSVNAPTAVQFGAGPRGRVFAVTLPAERVFSLPATGHGSLREGEVIVVGGATALWGGAPDADGHAYLQDPYPGAERRLAQSRYWS